MIDSSDTQVYFWSEGRNQLILYSKLCLVYFFYLSSLINRLTESKTLHLWIFCWKLIVKKLCIIEIYLLRFSNILPTLVNKWLMNFVLGDVHCLGKKKKREKKEKKDLEFVNSQRLVWSNLKYNSWLWTKKIRYSLLIKVCNCFHRLEVVVLSCVFVMVMIWHISSKEGV